MICCTYCKGKSLSDCLQSHKTLDSYHRTSLKDHSKCCVSQNLEWTSTTIMVENETVKSLLVVAYHRDIFSERMSTNKERKAGFGYHFATSCPSCCHESAERHNIHYDRVRRRVPACNWKQPAGSPRDTENRIYRSRFENSITEWTRGNRTVTRLLYWLDYSFHR